MNKKLLLGLSLVFVLGLSTIGYAAEKIHSWSCNYCGRRVLTYSMFMPPTMDEVGSCPNGYPNRNHQWHYNGTIRK